MGGSPPIPSRTIMPAATSPTMYKSDIPSKDFASAADYLNRIQAQTQKGREELFAQSGTPAELRAKQAGSGLQSAATYLSSLPGGDKYLKSLTGREDPYKEARTAAESRLTESQKAYADALQRIGEKPPEIDSTTRPSWAS